MARRMKRGLSGSLAEHAHELKKLTKELKTESDGAKRAMSKGHCDAAIGRMLTATYIAGEASAHAKESGRFIPKAADKAFTAMRSAVMRKCVLKAR